MVELGWSDLVEVIWLCQVNLGWHGCVWLGGGWYGYVFIFRQPFNFFLLSPFPHQSYVLSFSSYSIVNHGLPAFISTFSFSISFSFFFHIFPFLYISLLLLFLSLFLLSFHVFPFL